jgi:phenylpropionate dioxygenase-like ring-hydroxylating dioxygenase large terminal subunit
VTIPSPLPLATDADQPGFATHPASWYYLGTVLELVEKPLRLDLPGGHSYVGFRTKSGKLAVLNARCAHMGADLAAGCVVGERLACPLHGWEYSREGNCEHVPVSADIPAFARQVSFPVEERGGHVFFLTGRKRVIRYRSLTARNLTRCWLRRVLSLWSMPLGIWSAPMDSI